MAKNMLFRRVIRVGEPECWLDKKTTKELNAIRKRNQPTTEAILKVLGPESLKNLRDVAKSAYVGGKAFSVPIGGRGGCDGWHWHPVEFNQATPDRPGLDSYYKESSLRWETQVSVLADQLKKIKSKDRALLPEDPAEFLKLFEFSYEYLPWPEGCAEPDNMNEEDVASTKLWVNEEDVERSREYVRQFGKTAIVGETEGGVAVVQQERTAEERAADFKALL